MDVRFRPRVSLRTAGLCLTAVCLVFGWYVERARRQRQAAQQVTQLEGQVYYAGELTADGQIQTCFVSSLGHTSIVNVEPRPLTWDQRTLGLDFFRSPAAITLSPAYPNVLRTIDWRSLNSVRSLDLSWSAVDDRDLECLSSLRQLRSLNLQAAHDITNAGLAHLSKLDQLETLDLTFAPISDAGIAELRGHPALKTLRLCATHVTDASIFILREIPHLREVNLYESRFTPEGIAALRAALPDCEVSD